MQVLFEKVDVISTEVLQFYSVKLGENDLTEIELFDEKDFPNHSKELEILYNVIDLMRERGAKSHYFKSEQGANALPVVTHAVMSANKKDYGLRLYCIRLTENLVVLLNGDIKTTLDPTECPNVRNHFITALKIARKLDKLLKEGEVNFTTWNCLLHLQFVI